MSVVELGGGGGDGDRGPETSDGVEPHKVSLGQVWQWAAWHLVAVYEQNDR